MYSAVPNPKTVSARIRGDDSVGSMGDGVCKRVRFKKGVAENGLDEDLYEIACVIEEARQEREREPDKAGRLSRKTGDGFRKCPKRSED